MYIHISKTRVYESPGPGRGHLDQRLPARHGAAAASAGDERRAADVLRHGAREGGLLLLLLLHRWKGTPETPTPEI